MDTQTAPTATAANSGDFLEFAARTLFEGAEPPADVVRFIQFCRQVFTEEKIGEWKLQDAPEAGMAGRFSVLWRDPQGELMSLPLVKAPLPEMPGDEGKLALPYSHLS